MIKRDILATRAACFADRKSYVAPDGREVLYKLDWERRKRQLWERCGGKCEEVTGGLRCLRVAIHPHHTRKRSKGRDDRLSNLEALCWYHHGLRHPEKQPKWRANDPQAHAQRSSD